MSCQNNVFFLFVFLNIHYYDDTAPAPPPSLPCRTLSCMHFLINLSNLWICFLVSSSNVPADGCRHSRKLQQLFRTYRYDIAMLVVLFFFFFSLIWEKQKKIQHYSHSLSPSLSQPGLKDTVEKVKLAALLGRCTTNERAGRASGGKIGLPFQKDKEC